MAGTSVESLVADVAAAFGHRLHEAGLPVTPERSARFATAVQLAQPQGLDDVYWVGRVTLVDDRDQLDRYDRIFREVFAGLIELSDARADHPAPAAAADAPGEARGADADEPSTAGGSVGNRPTTATPGAMADDRHDDHESRLLAAVSERERLAERDFSSCTQEELALIRRLVEQLPLVPPPRTGRRRRRHAAGTRLDMRGTLRRSHRTAGDPVDLVMRRRTERPRRVVLIADVSGSMEPYARIYLHLMRGAVQALHAEAFVFATRLTRLTRALAQAQPDLAYRRAVASAPDWSGGTRIGRALAAFLDEYGRRGMARGAVVVIVSDGWEIDSPELVGESMLRLSRLAHRVVWVNPRRAAEGYEPLVGGMAAALPYVDTFVSGHSIHALEEVMDAIRTATDRRIATDRRARVPA